MKRLLEYLNRILAASTSLIASPGQVLVAIQPEGSPRWIAVQALAAIMVVGKRLFIRTPKASFRKEGLLLVAAVVLAALGAAGTTWSLHLGLTTGAFKDGVILVNVLLMTQGARILVQGTDSFHVQAGV